jgi:hypothetical protein
MKAIPKATWTATSCGLNELIGASLSGMVIAESEVIWPSTMANGAQRKNHGSTLRNQRARREVKVGS